MSEHFCILASELPKKTQHSQALMQQHFTHTQKRAGSASVAGLSFPRPVGPSLLCQRQMDPIPSPQGTEGVVGMSSCHMTHRLEQNKERHIDLKQEKIFPYNTVNPAQSVRPLSLLVAIWILSLYLYSRGLSSHSIWLQIDLYISVF